MRFLTLVPGVAHTGSRVPGPRSLVHVPGPGTRLWVLGPVSRVLGEVSQVEGPRSPVPHMAHGSQVPRSGSHYSGMPNFIKKETLTHVFSSKFVKFLRTPFLHNTSGRLLVNVVVTKLGLTVYCQQFQKILNY